MKKIIEWLIRKFLPDYHLRHNPRRKKDGTLAKTGAVGGIEETGEGGCAFKADQDEAGNKPEPVLQPSAEDGP